MLFKGVLCVRDESKATPLVQHLAASVKWLARHSPVQRETMGTMDSLKSLAMGPEGPIYRNATSPDSVK